MDRLSDALVRRFVRNGDSRSDPRVRRALADAVRARCPRSHVSVKIEPRFAG